MFDRLHLPPSTASVALGIGAAVIFGLIYYSHGPNCGSNITTLNVAAAGGRISFWRNETEFLNQFNEATFEPPGPALRG